VEEKLLPQLSRVCVMPKSMSVQVASGTKVCCEAFLPQAACEIQGVKFCSDLKVLPKLQFDMIVGYDWLASFSTMKIHRAAKWMAIPYQGQTVVLQGILSELSAGSVVQLF
jgi:hypothetical protein